MSDGYPDPTIKRQGLREQLASARLLRFPGAFSPLVARLVADLGFEGVYVSGAALSADLALPDIGLTTLTEVAGRGQQIAGATELPVMVDADTGFGEPLNVARTVRTLEDAGVAGCHIEDQVNPKRCGHLDHKQVVEPDEMVRRVCAAVAARRDPAFVICARTDARGVEGLDAAIERAKAYVDAGADMIFPEALADRHEFAAFRAAIDVPLLANMTEFGKSPLLDTQTLSTLGFNVVIYPVTTLRLAMGAIESCLRTLLEYGTQQPLVNRMQTRARLYELLGYEDYAVFDADVFNFDLSQRSHMTTHDLEVHKGLAGVVVDRTAISNVVPETNSLTYRGYPVQELAASCSFEEVAYLIWHGELPDAAQLRAFCERERAQRELTRNTISVLSRLPDSCHPMDMLRTAVSCLGAEDPAEDDNSIQANQAKALSMMAKLPSALAFDYRRRHDLERIPADPELGFAENFLYMCFGEVPAAETVHCFEISLILYAEHSFNASTFTARTVASTLSDIYSAVTAAVGALKGPLHGGANEAVMHMMLEIDDPDRAGDWLREALAAKRKIMGFGHRVYKDGDSRVPTMKDAFIDMAELADGERWVRMYEQLERAMYDATQIKPNLDFPAGPAYYLMGFDIPMFTPIFVISRITGWTAHVIEQLEANALIRPLSLYAGADQRPVPQGAVRLVL